MPVDPKTEARRDTIRQALLGRSITRVTFEEETDLVQLELDNGLRVWPVGDYGEEARLHYGETNPNVKE